MSKINNPNYCGKSTKCTCMVSHHDNYSLAKAKNPLLHIFSKKEAWPGKNCQCRQFLSSETQGEDLFAFTDTQWTQQV